MSDEAKKIPAGGSMRDESCSSRTTAPDELCPACQSPDLAKIKGCIRCLRCGFKQDCNGW
jgi:hypothetical protein